MLLVLTVGGLLLVPSLLLLFAVFHGRTSASVQRK